MSTAITSLAGPYEYTATGLLGDKREAMLHNELHLRKTLGRPYERGYVHFPGRDGLYGKPYPPDDGGASEALRGWPSIRRKAEEAKHSTYLGRDFMALNRAAVNRGLTTAREVFDFRAQNDIPRKPPKVVVRSSAPPRLPATMTFGMPTRPCTPINDVLQHKFQDLWLKDRFSGLAKEEQVRIQSMRAGQVNETRTSMLRRYQEPVEAPLPWKMPRFEKRAHAALDTFRTPEDKMRAYKYFSSDSIPRRGDFGQGIPEPAKY